MPDTLQRFHEAQKTSFPEALAEIEAGQKKSHWIWFIFPQIAGLGHSSTAVFYALANRDEAQAYLRDPVLFKNYLDVALVVEQRLSEGARLHELMGSEIDALKLVSSLTLFREAAGSMPKEKYHDLSLLCDRLLASAATQGYPACRFTLSEITKG